MACEKTWTPTLALLRALTCKQRAESTKVSETNQNARSFIQSSHRSRRQWRHGFSVTGVLVHRFSRAGMERVLFFTQPHETRAVEHHYQRTRVVQNGGDDRIQITKGTGGPAADDEENTEQEILVDDAARLAGQFDEKGQAAQVVVHERNGRAVDGDLAAGGAHRDAHVTRGQRRGVIDTVTDHSDAITTAFHFADKLDLVLRKAFGDDLLTTDLARHSRGNRLTVAGDHRDA